MADRGVTTKTVDGTTWVTMEDYRAAVERAHAAETKIRTHDDEKWAECERRIAMEEKVMALRDLLSESATHLAHLNEKQQLGSTNTILARLNAALSESSLNPGARSTTPDPRIPDALLSIGDALARRLRHVVGPEDIVRRWEDMRGGDIDPSRATGDAAPAEAKRDDDTPDP